VGTPETSVGTPETSVGTPETSVGKQVKSPFFSTDALSGVFLWVMFGYLAVLLNCDLQRFLKNNWVVLHVTGLITFFFLFSIFDGGVADSVTELWLKTSFVYVLFILMTKSKWYFVTPVIAIILIDQTIKKHVQIQGKKHSSSEDAVARDKYMSLEKRAEQITNYINVAIVSLIVVGNVHYAVLQRIEYKDDFSFVKFFFSPSNSCADSSPKYKRMRRSYKGIKGSST
jgi:hypothetical protein